MKLFFFLLAAFTLCVVGCSNDKEKIVVPTNAPTTNIEPVGIGGGSGGGGATGGLNKKIPGKK